MLPVALNAHPARLLRAMAILLAAIVIQCIPLVTAFQDIASPMDATIASRVTRDLEQPTAAHVQPAHTHRVHLLEIQDA
jgi:hypothetical protein